MKLYSVPVLIGLSIAEILKTDWLVSPDLFDIPTLQDPSSLFKSDNFADIEESGEMVLNNGFVSLVKECFS